MVHGCITFRCLGYLIPLVHMSSPPPLPRSPLPLCTIRVLPAVWRSTLVLCRRLSLVRRFLPINLSTSLSLVIEVPDIARPWQNPPRLPSSFKRVLLLVTSAVVSIPTVSPDNRYFCCFFRCSALRLAASKTYVIICFMLERSVEARDTFSAAITFVLR